MIFDSEALSYFEKCPRYPSIYRIFDPPRWPIRDGVKHWLARGIKAFSAGRMDPESFEQQLLSEAAGRGFEYPESTTEIYNMAKDYASWLNSCLHLIQQEQPMGIVLCPVYKVGNQRLNIEAYTDGDSIRLYRASSNISDHTARWPELCAAAITGKQVIVTQYHLPGIRSGRVHSPLCLAYRHPVMETNFRLARKYDEPEFKKSWKKYGRWEIYPEPTWEEWSKGIVRDECIDSIRESFTVGPILDEIREKIRFDIEHMLEVMERPDLWPRYREACQSCVYAGLCHGDAESRSQYIIFQEAFEEYKEKLSKISLDNIQQV